MAETPKGDTASPTDAPDSIPDQPIRLGDASRHGDRRAPDGTIAGDVGEDHLAGDAEPAAGPWSADTADRIDPEGDDRVAEDVPAAAPKQGGLRRTLLLVILLALVIGGAYASYPMWRAEVEPLARQLGITLPTVGPAAPPRTAEAPEAAPSPAGPAPSEPTPSEPTPGEPTPGEPTPGEPTPGEPTPGAEAPAPQPGAAPADTGRVETPPQPVAPVQPPATVADPALAGDVERLIDRVAALEQRLAAIEDRPAEATKADAGQVEQLESRVDGIAQSLTAVTDEMAIVREGLATSGGGEGLGPMAAQLSERLQGLTDRIAAIEDAAPGTAQLPDRLQAVAERLDAIEESMTSAPAEPAVKPERIDALQARVDGVAGSLDSEVRKSAEDLARLEGRLTSVQGQLDRIAKTLESTRSGREQAGGFLLAANQLAAATAGSGGFEAELEAVRAGAPADGPVTAAIDLLDRHAAGVPSLAVLRARFDATASAAVRASVVGSDEGFLGQALNQVASLVTIRRTDVTEGDGLDALLIRAESALAAGDLAAAVEAMRRLDGDPAAAVSAWLADAEARAAVDGAVRTLQSRALAGMAGG